MTAKPRLLTCPTSCTGEVAEVTVPDKVRAAHPIEHDRLRAMLLALVDDDAIPLEHVRLRKMLRGMMGGSAE